jgi:RNA polymerase sigma factor (TIGR02999 family)
MSRQHDVTQLLEQASAGDAEAFDDLLGIVYEEMRQMAHRQLLGERKGHTLNTTALVHEAYLKLVKLDRIQWKNRAQFFAIAAQAMRRVLVNYAVKRNAQKRGGGQPDVPLDDVVLMSEKRADAILALDEALKRLAALHDRQHRVVECRFFGGLSIQETADVLGVSPATVKRDWSMARAWLNRELGTPLSSDG